MEMRSLAPMGLEYAIFYLCIVIYFFRHLSKSFLKPASLLLALGITLTGTGEQISPHGEEFSARSHSGKTKRNHAFSKAEVFNDLVLPILESKCMSCPQEGKIKVNFGWIISRAYKKVENPDHLSCWRFSRTHI